MDRSSNDIVRCACQDAHHTAIPADQRLTATNCKEASGPEETTRRLRQALPGSSFSERRGEFSVKENGDLGEERLGGSGIRKEGRRTPEGILPVAQ